MSSSRNISALIKVNPLIRHLHDSSHKHRRTNGPPGGADYRI